MLGVKGLSWINAQRFASDRFPGGGNVFAEFHLAMLAVGLQRPEDLRACQMRLEKLMDSGNEAARVATQWVQGLASLFQNNPATAREEISFCKHEAARLGGSHAQRFVIEDTLAWLT
jgi:hypothetical protein